jgi:hypothetical protein
MLSHDHHGPCGCRSCNEPDECDYCGSQYRPECADCHGPVDYHEIDDDRLIAIGIECGAIRLKPLIRKLNLRSAVRVWQPKRDRQGLSEVDACSVVGGAA